MIKFSVTDHAKQRGRERNKWKAHTLERMVERVFYNGLAVTECAGQLRAFLENHEKDDSAYSLRIYGNDLFIFARPEPDVAALVTLYHLPSDLSRVAHTMRRHQNALAA